jgi:hypothetical protein
MRWVDLLAAEPMINPTRPVLHHRRPGRSHFQGIHALLCGLPVGWRRAAATPRRRASAFMKLVVMGVTVAASARRAAVPAKAVAKVAANYPASARRRPGCGFGGFNGGRHARISARL